MKPFILGLFLPAVVLAQTNSTLIFGIGIGTFIIIISIVFSIIWCLACRSSARPEIYSIFGIIPPLVLTLAFIFTPKQKDRPTIKTISDNNYVTHAIFIVLGFVVFLLSLILLWIDWCFGNKKAKNIARSAFVYRQDQENEALSSKSRVGVSRALSRSNLGEGDQSEDKINESRLKP